MAPETLGYISTHVTCSDELKALLRSFKSSFNTSEITVAQAERILAKKQNEVALFIVHPTVYRPKELSMQYDCFKRRIRATITPISLLEGSLQSVIFGIFYRDRSGMPVLEDDHGIVVLSLEACECDLFLHENMFVALSGRKEEEVFLVESAILPSVGGTANGGMAAYDNAALSCADPAEAPEEGRPPSERPSTATPRIHCISNAKNNFLAERPARICIFGCYTDQRRLIDVIVEKHKPDLVVVTLCICNRVPYESSATRVILCPCRCAGRLLPDKLLPKTASINTTNPFMLELHSRKIAFIDYNLFSHKSSGIFCNKQPLESFLRSLYSQQSYSPFAPCDLSFGLIPDIFVMMQDFYPFVMDVESVRMVSILPVKAGSYVFIDTGDDTIEVLDMSVGKRLSTATLGLRSSRSEV